MTTAKEGPVETAWTLGPDIGLLYHIKGGEEEEVLPKHTKSELSQVLFSGIKLSTYSLSKSGIPRKWVPCNFGCWGVKQIKSRQISKKKFVVF